MHSAVLDATSYTLLLSSFITLVILLWKGCRRQKKKKLPFYILSTSDVLSAASMAVILLTNPIEAGMKLTYNWQENISDIANHAWTFEDNYRFPFLQTHDLRETFSEVERNVTLTCDMKDILVQYGMLLAALTNAFVSLLTFTVQCNLNAACIKKRCANLMKSLRNTRFEGKGAEAKCRGNEMFESEEEPASLRDSINVKIRNNVVQKIMEMKLSKFRMPEEDDRKPTGFLVMSHWLVPFLIVGILYFADYSDMNDIRHVEEIECVFESNFPMNDFDTLSDSLTDDHLNITDSVAYMTPTEYDYFLDEKLSNESKPNSIEINEVVSKVQNIIRSELSYRRNSTKDIETTNFLNTSESQNSTEYGILTNTIMRFIKNITNINSTVQGLNGTLVEQDLNVHNSSINNNLYVKQDSEVPLSYDVFAKNASEELDASTSGNLNSVSRVPVGNEDAQIYFASTEKSTAQMTTDITFVQNATFVSNNQIHGEIMKRIQAANVHSAAKNRYNRSVSRPKDGDRPEISDLKNYIAKRKPSSTKDLVADKSNGRYIKAETKQSGTHVFNECLISIKLLKLQLFVLSFAIYFLSILLSCILQVRGKYMCKNILTILRIRTDLLSSGEKHHHQDSAGGSSRSQGSGNEYSGIDDIDAIKKDRGSCRENESVALELDCVVRIFNIVKLSLILCVVLWTPVFLGILLRVYSCTRAPQWLTDVTFLSALSFGIIRNALNINIIRIQEACSDADMKENRVHPIE